MNPSSDDRHTFAILNDTTRCTGCEKCVAACKELYNLGPDRNWRWKSRIDDLSSTRFCTVIRLPGQHFVRHMCRHCKEPACVSACIVGALEKTPEGPVTYDSGKCMGCRYCMMACPYGIPRYDWEKAVPFVRKCIMCHQRVKDGKKPGCVEACPYGATTFGTRAELLEEARKRIADNPGRYYPADSPRIYGEHEVGGTGVLYLSNISLDFLGWKPDLGGQPLPALTWQALSKVPPIVAGVAALMSGTYWIIGRRMKLAAMAAEEKEAHERRGPHSSGN